jgi:hypothetical protein
MRFFWQALTSKDDELDEDELRLLDMRRAHSNGNASLYSYAHGATEIT